MNALNIQISYLINVRSILNTNFIFQNRDSVTTIIRINTAFFEFISYFLRRKFH
jgi:hypothetical protein